MASAGWAVRIGRIAALSAWLPLSGCATVALSAGTTLATPKIISAANAGPSLTRHAANEFPPVKPDKALVYFYREPAEEAAAVAFTVKEDGQVIGGLENGTYFYHYTQPGAHHYTITPANPLFKAEAGGRTLEFTGGETYHLQAIPQRYRLTVRAVVYPKFEGQAMPAMRKLTYATITSGKSD